MKTIASCVEELIKSQPFLEEGLSKGIINYSALAKELVAPVSDILKKQVKDGAIMMALRRYNTPVNIANTARLSRIFNSLGDITVRSNLSDFTFKNSKTLIKSHAQVLKLTSDKDHIFYAFTRGVFESNIIVSSSEKESVKHCFKNETQLELQEKLSAITVKLPKENTKISGLYYQIFKHLAWQGVAIYEVISTTNEFTILVEDFLVNKAFAVIKNLKT